MEPETGKMLKVEERMTWTEMITIHANTSLDSKQVISTFYQMPHAGLEEGLADITLLRDQGADNGFCIRLTWQGDIPKKGRSSLGYQLAKIFSERGQIDHTAWRRETSLHLLNWKRI